MYQNVINFKRNTIPNDLIKINDLAEKYNISYHFLYKWSVLAVCFSKKTRNRGHNAVLFRCAEIERIGNA